MALTKDWKQTVAYANPDDPDDVIMQERTIKDAYIVIDDYNGTKNSVNITVSIYKDRTKEELVERYLYTMPHNVGNDAQNLIKQAYLYVKEQPEFANAVDC